MKRKSKLFASAGAMLLLVSLSILGNSNAIESVSIAAPTFSKDVAPIFYNKCVSCHREGEIAPMSLLTYKQARPWARSIREKVLDRTMPPWHADPTYGEFRNERSLSKHEIETITAWVDGGAKEGDPEDLPPAPQFAEGWQIGNPDIVLTVPFEYSIPAGGVISYKYFMIPTDFKEDRWVQAAEIRPGNRAVVHHVIAFVVQPDAQRGRGGFGRGGLDALAGTAPGEQPSMLPDGVGKLVKAGSIIVLQMHYTPNGTPQKDRTSVGLIFNKKPVHKALTGGAAMNRFFSIPAGAENHRVTSSYRFRQDSHILNLMPHMHLRGKDFEYRLVYPDGSSKVILSVPRYDFNWQTRYEFAEPIAAPQGSRLECIAHFDNSAKNKWNPDASKTVRWGEQTWDEMMIGFVGFTRDNQNLSDSPDTDR